MQTSMKGVLLAISAFGLWGAFPFYFKAVGHVPPLEVLSNRIIWSAVLLFGLLFWLKRLKFSFSIFKNSQYRRWLLVGTLLIATNWGLYIWSVVTNQLFQASLGYYINPLINILLGLIFLGEKLRRSQWLAVLLAAIGVGLQMTYLDSFPWIACVLGLSFGLYGLLHKQIKVDSIPGLFVETLYLLPVALIYLAIMGAQHQGPLQWSINDFYLLILAGPVTVIPLLLFTAAAKQINYSIIGFIQYITPTVLFLLAAFYYQEPFNQTTLWSFGFIWIALGILSVDAILHQRRLRVSVNV